MKTYAYVDGFNLYFGALRGTPWKWLNIKALLELIFPRCHFIRIKYFTAKVTPRPTDPQQPVRQQVLLRALATLPEVDFYFGHFLTHEVSMPLVAPLTGGPAFARVFKTEEKGSDVNLASQLLHDASLKRFEQAIVVSGDSDLLMPVVLVKSELHLPVGVLNPQRHPCVVLQKNATFYKHIRPSALARCQFPATLRDLLGPFSKPASW